MARFPSCAARWIAVSTPFSISCQAPLTRIAAISTIHRLQGISFAGMTPVPDQTELPATHYSSSADAVRSPFGPIAAPTDLNDRFVPDLVDAVKAILRKEASDRLRDVY